MRDLAILGCSALCGAALTFPVMYMLAVRYFTDMHR